jgi:tetratricopeptide (TPR) repeat protein
VNLAELHLSLAQLSRAEENLDRAEELARAMGMTPTLSEICAIRGMLLAERGSLDRAEAEVERASEYAAPTGHVENLVRALLAQAAVSIATGHHGDARRAARQARDLARWSRMLHFELQAAFVGARACWKEGDTWDAARELRELVPLAEEGGFHPLAARAHDLLGTILWDAGDMEGAAATLVRGADQMKEIIATLSEDDLRSFVHHPEWKVAIGNLLDTLMRLGRRDEALAYLVPLGVGTCDLGTARETPSGLGAERWDETRFGAETGVAEGPMERARAAADS